MNSSTTLSTQRKIVFLISSLKGINTGIGGHYRSVKEIADLLRSTCDVSVITFGDIPSPVFSGDPNYIHVSTASSLSPFGLSRLRNILEKIATTPEETNPPAILISVGWVFSCASAYLGSLGRRVTRVHLKPGGGKAIFPSLLNGMPMAVFDQKDYDDFHALDSFRPIALVPGRVTQPAYDPIYFESSTRPFKGHDGLKILSIMRVASDKKIPTLMIYDAMSRIDAQNPNLAISFTHCGTIQDNSLLGEMKKRRFTFPTAIVSDASTTKFAPKYLHGHNAFVGIGRALIEAMSLGIPAFIPIKGPNDAIHLCAVTKDNWRVFLYENFTHRVDYSTLYRAGEFIELTSFVMDKGLQQRLSKEVKFIYEMHLSPEASHRAWNQLLFTQHTQQRFIDNFKRTLYLLFLELKRLMRLTLKGLT